MEDAILDTSRYGERIAALVDRFNDNADVEIVADIAARCRDVHIEEFGFERCGKTVRVNATGRYLILVASPITQSMANGVIGAMREKNRASQMELESLADPERFLSHLVLHEVAHTLDPDQPERACDRWAFEQMEKGHAV